MTKYLFSSGSKLRLVETVESFKRSTQNLQKKKSADQEAQKMEPAVAWHRGPPAGFPLQRALLALVDQSQQKANTSNGAKLTREQVVLSMFPGPRITLLLMWIRVIQVGPLLRLSCWVISNDFKDYEENHGLWEAYKISLIEAWSAMPIPDVLSLGAPYKRWLCLPLFGIFIILLKGVCKFKTYRKAKPIKNLKRESPWKGFTWVQIFDIWTGQCSYSTMSCVL